MHLHCYDNPQPISRFRGPMSPIPSKFTSLIQSPLPKTASQVLLLFTFGLRFSSSCAAVSVLEPTPAVDLASNDHAMLPVKFNGGFDKIPQKHQSSSRGSFKKTLNYYSGMLHDCAARRSLKQGRLIHGHLIASGVKPDSHLWVSLINAYAKSGCPGCARKVLDVMPERDVVSWTALITGFVGEGYASDGVSLFCEMRREGVRPNEFTLATGLKACSVCCYVGMGKQVHVEAIKTGLFLDLFVGSALVDNYAKCGEMELASSVFRCMPDKSVVSWNALLNGYAQIGDGKEVMKLFCKMTECEMRLSKFTLSTFLKGCVNMGCVRAGQVVHSLAIRIGFEHDEFLGCSLVDMYSKCGRPSDALKVFEGIKDPDVVAWSAMITCLHQQGQSQEADKLFHLMRCRGLGPNEFTLSSLIRAATDLGDIYFGESIHASICKYGFEYDNTVGNALITMYMKNRCIQDGTRVFATMADRDAVTWNALLSGFHDVENCDQGPRIFYQMLVAGIKPNMDTFINILRSCSSLFDINFGKQVHAHIVKNRLDSNYLVGTALVDMYAKSRCLEDADVAFNSVINPDHFTWTAIITCCAQNDQAEKTMKYFSQMQQEGIKPNEFTMASCLSGCSRIATLENGRQIHSVAIKAGLSNEMFVASALVNMYGKCGCMEDAEAVFEGMVSHDTVSWNTMICGYSQNGQGEKALEVFKMMLDVGDVPDEVTFLGVLLACCYKGLIEEGKSLFNLMREVYGINPAVEHYGCMVDILGRAGKFNEVESFIREMKLAPYNLIWETVLGACRLHGNVELGQRAADKLFQLAPGMDSSYVLLSDIFAAKGRWDDVRKVRVLMTDRGIKKKPGCSWVEIDGQVHVFASQDSSHPKMREICIKLEELGQKLMSVGYVPQIEHVLHDVTDTDKMTHLYHHSEKLALAFALIGTLPTKTIRIFKNLRTCQDCHDFMKLISHIADREIVVRDTKRFHLFRGGACSCQDYW